MPWFLENVIGPWGDQVRGDYNYELGLRLRVDAVDWELQKVRWYRIVTGTPGAIVTLHFWDAVAATNLATWTAPDNGAIGWQELTVDPPIALTSGNEYWISACIPIGKHWGEIAGNPAAPPAPLVVPSGARRWTSVCNVFGYSTGAYTSAFDAFVAETAPPPPPPGGGDIQAGLIDWFDPLEATKPTSNVKLYPRVIARLDSLNAAAIAWLNDRSTDAVNLLDLASQGWVNFLNDPVGYVNAAINTPGNSVRKSDGTAVTTLADAIIATLAAQQAQLNTMAAQITAIQAAVDNLGAAVGSFPFGWTLLDETDWNVELAWPVAADLYVNHFTAWPPTFGTSEAGGLNWLHRAGWWTTLNGNQASERRFLDMEWQQLHQAGATMPGILIRSRQGFAGHIQAWQRP